MIIFPFSYILGDIFTEVYGFNKNKKIIWISFFCNLLMVVLFVFVINLPYPESFNYSKEYEIVLGTTPRILIASLVGFIAGGFANSVVMSKLKILTKGKLLPLRTILSTVIGEAIDTLLFIIIAFFGNLSNEVLIKMVIFQSIMKIVIEVIATPITCLVISKIKRIENIDVYDNNEKYNLF